MLTKTVQLRCMSPAYVDADKSSKDGVTPLYYASQTGQADICRILLSTQEPGAQRIRNSRGAARPGVNSPGTPLHCVSTQGQADIFRMLSDHRADAGKASKNGFTPLACASNKGQADICRMLLDRRADDDRADRGGFSSETC